MHITMPTVTHRPIRSLLPWRKLVVAAVFMLTLFFTVRVASLAIAVIFPDTQADPAAVQAAIKDLMAEPSAPPDADLTTLGFIPDNPVDTGVATTTVSFTATVATATSTLAAPTSTSQPAATALPIWDRKGRVNILLLGLDGASNQGRFRRADTIIVASFDPATNSAVMLSIPRDLFVTFTGLPKVVRNRINTGWVWGEYYNYPGGGPAMEMRIVQETLGIPIHHYIATYFDGVPKVIDALGGIDVQVDKPIRDTFTHWYFPAGLQHMNGDSALKYARSRYSTSDFSRARRQQQVLLAARDKALKADILPRLPALLPALMPVFKTDLSISDIMALANTVSKIDMANIKNTIIDETMVSGFTTSDGARVLLPKMDKIRTLVKTLFTTPTDTTSPVTATTSLTSTTSITASAPVVLGAVTPVTSPATTSTPAPAAIATLDAYRAEQAKVEILNGTNTIGLAKRCQTWLEGQGFQVVRVADATGLYKQTVVYADSAKPLTRDALVKQFSVTAANVRLLQTGGVNIRIVLGADAKVP